MNRRSFFASVTALVFWLLAARPRKSKWTHVGKVYHGTLTDVYINGVRVG